MRVLCMSIEHSPVRQDGAGDSSQDGELPGIGHNHPPGGLLDEYFTKNECAAELNVAPRTLDRWHRLREGPPRTIIGRRIFYHIGSTRDWVRGCEETIEL